MTVARRIGTGDYYHVYNRGFAKRNLFVNQTDWVRMLFAILYYQSPARFDNTRRLCADFDPSLGFNTTPEEFSSVIGGRQVELVAFSLMPNHYHLLIRELIEGGLSRYLQRVQVSYTMYWNAKYETSGHVFQGRYNAKHIADNEYLTHLSAYIHRNPRELKAWKGREADYPWSSYQDYVKENRWGGLLAQEIILDQFEGTKQSNYADFVKTSPAKGFGE